MKESNIERLIMMAAPKLGARLFRNTRGRVLDARSGNWIAYGLGGNGSADQLGWTTVTVTPEMVGNQIAIFTSVEVKRPNEKARTEQEAWANAVRAAGGIAGVCRSEEDLKEMLSYPLTSPCRGENP